jgi:hypothetical protein
VAGCPLGAAAVTLSAHGRGAAAGQARVPRPGPSTAASPPCAGMFAPALPRQPGPVYAAEVAAVRHARLWPRAPGPEPPHGRRCPRAGSAGPRARNDPRRPC